MKTSDIIWQDTQHQILFRLIDEIAVEPFNPHIFTELQLYAEHHFTLEEAYMKELNYPGMKDHIQAHNKFRQELQHMIQDKEKLDSAIRTSLSLFLSEWLKRHVLGIDKKFEAFLLSADAK